MPVLLLLLALPLILLAPLAANLIDDVGHLITGTVDNVVNLASRVWHSIKAVWTFVTKIFELVGDAWSIMYNGTRAILGAIWDGSVAVFDTLKWLLTTALPKAATWAVGRAVKLATTAVGRVERALTAAIRAVGQQATKAVNALTGWARSAIRDLGRDLGGALKWISVTGRKASDLVLHPDRLARWIVKDLLAPLLRLILTGSGDVLVALIRGFAGEESEIAHMLESVLARVL